MVIMSINGAKLIPTVTAYNEFINNSVPNEIWLEIACYLQEPEELYHLQLVCKSLFSSGSTDSLWQPLLNRLHAIDDTISPIPKLGQSIRQAFIEGFTFIKQEQEAEINNLLCFHKKRAKNYFLDAKLPHGRTTLFTLEQRHTKLDDFNRKLVIPVLDDAKQKHLHIISFDGLGISRFPQDVFCRSEYNNLFKRLIGLSCDRNLLRKFPKSIRALTALRVLTCSVNYIHTLPEEIGELAELRTLICTENDLGMLPEALSKPKHLQTLNCQTNELKALPIGLIYKLGLEWGTRILNDQRKRARRGQMSF